MHARQPGPYTSHVYPSQVFYNPSFNPLYNHAYAGTFGFGDHNNFDMKPSAGFAPNFYADFNHSAQTARGPQSKVQSGKAKDESTSASASASASGTNGF
jgi:hypothetical protein